MQLNVKIGTRTVFPKSELFVMHRLHTNVFSGRIGGVPIMSGMEIDACDAMDSDH
ncbi:hypothetical protein [Undibacterium rugosum]|uniref:Uncharacterized protein n=1 Tax=Undibacterium rugosum TaxID=2762291 RepID=A0A923I6I2_9BURK|nr:hypothetical protein [Undibacterium rugosum]MBC3934468.1 hypothetical protein [Undibacterium rugosum]MBR7777083.1 hypothetical protein [Undibacterium rugosum]